MTYDEMIDFLRQHGADVDTFDKRGGKSLATLYEEIQQEEMQLIYHDGHIGRVSKSVRVTVTAEGRVWFLRETERIYPNGFVVPKQSHWTVSETRRRNETSAEATVRCLKEECDLRISLAQVEIPDWRIVPRESYECRKSSVYPDLWSYNLVDWTEVHLEHRPWTESEKIVDDNGVKIRLVWDNMRALKA